MEEDDNAHGDIYRELEDARHYNRMAGCGSTLAIVCSILTLIVIILANLDKIVSF